MVAEYGLCHQFSRVQLSLKASIASAQSTCIITSTNMSNDIPEATSTSSAADIAETYKKLTEAEHAASVCIFSVVLLFLC